MTGLPGSEGTDGATPRRELAARAERSLKDVDRLLRRTPEATPHDRALAQLEHAKVLALLQLAEAVRAKRGAAAPPT